VIKEGLGPEFDFPRRRLEAARVSFVVSRRVLDVTGRQRFPQSGRFGSKLIQGNAARAKLISVSRIDITVPKMLTKAELGIAETEITKVKNGTFVLLPISDQTHGHITYNYAAAWQQHLQVLLKSSQR